MDANKAGFALKIPESFRRTALAFPRMAKAAIAKISNGKVAADGLAKAQALADYARRIKATNEETNSIQYGKLLLAAKVGELCPAASAKERGAKGGRGNKATGASSVAFDTHTLADYRKLARHQADGKIDAYWETTVGAEHQAEMSIVGFLNYVGSGDVIATRHGGGVIEWYTPKEYITKVRKVLGTIELDPATSEVAQRIVKAKIYYDKEDDGLARNWQGRVFLNPPFKMPLIAQFVGKLCDEYEAERVTQAVLLTNNNTDTDWWQRIAKTASALCFTDGRISFYNEAGETSSPTNGQSFAYFGDDVDRFIQVFSEVGICLGTFDGDP